jgi:hypothetical protein
MATAWSWSSARRSNRCCRWLRKKVKDEAARIAAIRRATRRAKWLDAALRTAGVLQEGETL